MAREILLREKRPLGAKAILAVAYQHGLVPHHLYGRTQHKTLQARLSEDIVRQRERSSFFRPEPGKFFLRQFLTDSEVPEDFRRPIATRRRSRDLMRGPALAIELKFLREAANPASSIASAEALNLLKNKSIRCEYPKLRAPDVALVWSFVFVRRHSDVLTYRIGRYRDDRDLFVRRQSLGFTSLIGDDERSLFDYEEFGVVSSGVRSVKIDLNIPDANRSIEDERGNASLLYFTWVSQPSGYSDFLAVVDFRCPEWYEPTKRRLALNDLKWRHTRSINNVDDFDPWSKSVLTNSYREDIW